MHYGCNGQWLRINLTGGTSAVEAYDDSFRRRYLGGWGWVAHTLLKELPPGIDPLGPDNKLLFANGTVTGAAVGGSGRSSVGGKSPLTGGFGVAEAGGFFGAELARAGFDALIIEGQASTPVYLWIHDGQVEIRPAEHLWGCLTARTQAMLHEELGDHRVRVAQIGPAGERLAPIAAVMHDINRAAARTGLGAVMGSKRLKAVAVRGTRRIPVAQPALLQTLAKGYVAHFPHTWVNHLRELGTAAGVASHQLTGGLPAYNFHQSVFPDWESLTGERMAETILKDRDTCFACPVHCKRVVAIQEGPYPVDPAYGGPEYETIGALGPLCGVADLAAVSHANQLCNAYGLDTISTGVTIAWAMDCFERGLLTPADTGGLELRYGRADTLVHLVELMGKREGFGQLLSLGSQKAAQAIGRGTAALAVHVKGLEVPMHEPRVKYGLGIGYAVSPTGADHNHNFHDTDYTTPKAMEPLKPFGITEPLPFQDLSPAKMHLASVEIPWSVATNLLGFCLFIYQSYDRPNLVELVRAVTGWEVTLEELLRAGERAYTLARAFNAREGFRRQDDRLPAVFFEPVPEGPSRGNRLDPAQVDQALTQFYTRMGWDPVDGIPTGACLEALDLGWVRADLERCGASR
jgi:aldehyde:ferredoxin oxidoreductase